MTLLEIFRNPGELAGISLPGKLLGAIQITVIGMALTFVALVLVWLAVRLLSRFTAPRPARELTPPPLPRTPKTDDTGEEVAAITAVLALLGEVSPDRIRVRKIVRSSAGGSRWSDWNRE